MVSRYQKAEGNRLHSEILLADAQNTGADVWVTLSVLASTILMQLTGWWWLDIVAALGVTLPEDAERLDMELPTANVPLSQPLEASTLAEALFSYQRAADLLRDALAEYNYHLDEYKNNLGTYLSHLDHVELVQALAQADHDYLAALTATGDARKPLMASARENYEKARANLELLQLEVDRLENKIKSLAELAVNRQEPDFISGQIDQVAHSMLETEKTMNDLRFATDLAPLTEEAPELLRFPPVQVME